MYLQEARTGTRQLLLSDASKDNKLVQSAMLRFQQGVIAHRHSRLFEDMNIYIATFTTFTAHHYFHPP
jgi:hypothetical protein